MPSIHLKSNLINNQQQELFTSASVSINITSGFTHIFILLSPNFILVPFNIILDPANTFGSILPIYQLAIISRQTQIGLIPPINLPEQSFNTSVNFYI